MKITIISLILLSTLLCRPALCGEIHDAAQSGDLAKVKALLKDNPDLVSSKDNNGGTPLHMAALGGHKDIVELLVANKADVNAKNNYGMTPLHVSAIFNHKDVAELLLANKADVNAKNGDGDTPLNLAVSGGFTDLAELLRQHGGQAVKITALTKLYGTDAGGKIGDMAKSGQVLQAEVGQYIPIVVTVNPSKGHANDLNSTQIQLGVSRIEFDNQGKVTFVYGVNPTITKLFGGHYKVISTEKLIATNGIVDVTLFGGHILSLPINSSCTCQINDDFLCMPPISLQ